jgi:hypothetical protein
MTEPKLLSPGMIAAAMLATPVMAGKHHLSARRVANDTKCQRSTRRALVIT